MLPRKLYSVFCILYPIIFVICCVLIIVFVEC